MGIKEMKYVVGERVSFRHSLEDTASLLGTVIGVYENGDQAWIDWDGLETSKNWDTKRLHRGWYIDKLESAKPKIKVTMGKWKLKG